MRSAVFFEGSEESRKRSRFWILLVLAAVISAAGVVADSTATVIGAMIVAPLMVPIQAVMLAVVLGDRPNLARSVALVTAGALVVVLVGFLVGVAVVPDVVARTNGQVAGRTTPRLIDLVAALATGVVGSVALTRRDISDTLPGVAIAISLVPPLSVVGLTLESGEPREALGALLLFVTNVTAILATGTVVMVAFGANRVVRELGTSAGRTARRGAMATIAIMVVLVVAPLTLSSISIARSTAIEADVHRAGQRWAAEVGWELVDVTSRTGEIVVRFEGPLPIPEVDGLRAGLVESGVDAGAVRVELVPSATIDLGD